MEKTHPKEGVVFAGLTQDGFDWSFFFNSLKEFVCPDQFYILERNQEKHLKSFFKNKGEPGQITLISFLRARELSKQTNFLKSFGRIFIIEHDACQNYIEDSKNQLLWSRLLSDLPWAKIAVSGVGVSERLKKEGHDAVFVSKGYDPTVLYDTNSTRDIEVGFIGSIRNPVYKKRNDAISWSEKNLGLKKIETSPGPEYASTLNRIKFFINSDEGLEEYMIKNFEAMACGCVLCTFDQGIMENDALGFKDMRNVILYKDVDELRKKIRTIQCNQIQYNSIRSAGKRLVVENHSWKDVAVRINRQLGLKFRKKKIKNTWYGKGSVSFE